MFTLQANPLFCPCVAYTWVFVPYDHDHYFFKSESGHFHMWCYIRYIYLTFFKVTLVWTEMNSQLFRMYFLCIWPFSQMISLQSPPAICRLKQIWLMGVWMDGCYSTSSSRVLAFSSRLHNQWLLEVCDLQTQNPEQSWQAKHIWHTVAIFSTWLLEYLTVFDILTPEGIYGCAQAFLCVTVLKTAMNAKWIYITWWSAE